MIRQWFGFLILAACMAIILVSCNPPVVSPLEPSLPPSSPPSITEIASPILDTSATPAPLTAATAAIVIESSQVPPTATLLPPVVSLPTEQIQIFQPGPASQLTSPFRVAGWGGPSYKDRVKLKLLGEDGRVLAHGTTWLHVLAGNENAGRFYFDITFDIQLVAEAARLEVSTYSYRDRQLSHLNTVNLTLLSVGNPLVHPAITGPEKLAIFSPRKEAVVEGGLVTVQGAGWVDSELPLAIEVLDRNGEVLGSTEFFLDAPATGQLGTFQVEVSYQVTYPQWGRIAVSEHSADIPGLIHYSSVEVWLRP